MNFKPLNKVETIDYLISCLERVDKDANSKMINILQENKYKPIKEIRRLICDVDYEINQKYDFGILNSLFDIYYTEPEWGWE